MPNGFNAVPDWFSWANQGAGAAVADLDDDGRPELVVLMVDDGPGQNQGLYRVGKSLDAEGAPRAGWGPWLAIPDWFPWANEGAGLAVADLDGDGRPELVVFMIDSPPGQNQGYYRVGRGLDADGNVTGGWGPWLAIPDWFPWMNQHGSVAAADLDGDGRPELVVFMIDSPPGQNQGYYRVGRGLGPDGAVAAWSQWEPVPGWFSWENQGAGVAIADLDGSGLADLIVFQVDSPPGQNQAFYKIGKNLGADGAVEGGWGPWHGVPGWLAWENQGAAVAAARRDGSPELLVLMVDSPPGQNAGLYRMLTLQDDPQARGSWELKPFHSEVLGVHTAVLPSGKVLFYAGAGSSLVRFDSPDFGDIARGVPTSAVWDPAVPQLPGQKNNFSHPATLRGPGGRPYDFFCGGDTFLPDGQLLHAGGSLDYPRPGHGFFGLREAFSFDHRSEQWARVADMAQGRWYPSLITMGDGRVLAVSGLDEHGGLNTSLELYDAAADAWQQLPAPPPQEFIGLPLYAHIFLLADGRVFFTGGRMDDPSPLGPCLLDLSQSPAQVTPVAGLADPQSRNQSASVLLPPAQEQRVMIIGGGPEDETDATDGVDIIDFRAANPVYQAATPLNLPRMHLNAVLLPDRTVLVTGGSLRREFGLAARLEPEIYDPATDTWSIMASATVPRLYHSTAVLLPDGRVVAAGSNPEGGQQVPWFPPDPDEEMRLDIFSPPYLFRGPRPQIGDAPARWGYGQTISVATPQAGAIRWASLIRPGVTTHSFNSDQRLVDAPIVDQGAGRIQVRVTESPNIAPPGWYMLFLVDERGVPSEARWVQIGPG